MFKCTVCDIIWEPRDKAWEPCPGCGSDEADECPVDEGVRREWIEDLAQMAKDHLEWDYKRDGDASDFADAIIDLCRTSWHLPDWWDWSDRDYLISLLEQ